MFLIFHFVVGVMIDEESTRKFQKKQNSNNYNPRIKNNFTDLTGDCEDKRIMKNTFPSLNFDAIWKILKKQGWWEVTVQNRTDPVYKAMNFFSTIYINVLAVDKWNLNCFFNKEIIAGIHYFERCVRSHFVLILYLK